MPEMGKEALSATKRTAHKFIDMTVMYILPLVTFFAGAVSGRQTWGGINAMYSLLTSSGNSTITSGVNSWHGWVDAGIFGGIFGGIGYGFWSLGHEDGVILKAIGRGFGGYFWGTAVSYLLFAIGGPGTWGGASDGLIDNFIADVQGL